MTIRPNLVNIYRKGRAPWPCGIKRHVLDWEVEVRISAPPFLLETIGKRWLFRMIGKKRSVRRRENKFDPLHLITA